MSTETIKTGWLNDKEGNKFAPKTLTSQVQTSDGTLLEDKIQADLDAVKTDVDEKLDEIKDAKADWNQNDETALDYIKNRTHYDDIKATLKTQQEIWDIIEELPDYSPGTNVSEPILVEGLTFRVVVDGVVYDNVPVYVGCYIGGGYTYCIGDAGSNGQWKTLDYGFGYSMYGNLCNEEFFPNGIESINVYTVEQDLKQLDPKYIKDMYYTSEPVEIEVVPETTIEFSGEPSIDPFTLEFSEGETCHVTWNDTRYDCVAYMSNVGGLAIGNAAIGDAGTGGNDEPFFCILYNGHVLLFAAETGTYTISISKIEQEIHHIPTKYVKDMYYDNGIILTESIPSQTISGFFIMKDPIYAVENPFPLTLTVGDTYLVNWDGTEYELVCETVEGINYIGNENYIFVTPGGDIPFTVLTDDQVFIATESTEESHTISIAEIKHDIKQLDEKYLSILEEKPKTIFEMNNVVSGNEYENPVYKKIVGKYLVTIDDNSPKEVEFIDHGEFSIVESDFILIRSVDGLIHIELLDEESHYVKIENFKNVIKSEYLDQPNWDQNDKTAADYIKNRTHYEEVKKTSIEGMTIEVTVPTNTGGVNTHNLNIPFEMGQKWNIVPPIGTIGAFENVEVMSADDGTLYIGEESTIDTYPFYITKNTSKANGGWVSNALRYSYCILVGVSGYITSTEVKQLDQKYIPNADWNQNDETAAGYIKNRTHYEENVEEILVDESIYCTGYGAFSAPITFIEGASYTLYFRDTNCGTVTYTSSLGNNVVFGGEYDCSISSSGITASKNTPDGSYAVKLICSYNQIHQLDEKYIPDIIVRQTDLDNAVAQKTQVQIITWEADD